VTEPRELSDAEKRALPCFQNPGPWQDTTKKAELEWAARQCQVACQQKAWCHSQRQIVLREFGVATGVWAGQVYTDRENALLVRVARQARKSETGQ